jgi:hypothetical protein
MASWGRLFFRRPILGSYGAALAKAFRERTFFAVFVRPLGSALSISVVRLGKIRGFRSPACRASPDKKTWLPPPVMGCSEPEVDWRNAGTVSSATAGAFPNVLCKLVFSDQFFPLFGAPNCDEAKGSGCRRERLISTAKGLGRRFIGLPRDDRRRKRFALKTSACCPSQ